MPLDRLTLLETSHTLPRNIPLHESVQMLCNHVCCIGTFRLHKRRQALPLDTSCARRIVRTISRNERHINTTCVECDACHPESTQRHSVAKWKSINDWERELRACFLMQRYIAHLPCSAHPPYRQHFRACACVGEHMLQVKTP